MSESAQSGAGALPVTMYWGDLVNQKHGDAIASWPKRYRKFAYIAIRRRCTDKGRPLPSDLFSVCRETTSATIRDPYQLFVSTAPFDHAVKQSWASVAGEFEKDGVLVQEIGK